MTKFGIGQPVPRTEDARLLRGEGRYTDDVTLPGTLHLHVLRSPHANARIDGMDVEAALAAPGVRAVLTAADLVRAGVKSIACLAPVRNRDGTPMADKPRPVLATDRVRFVGDAVAAIVADTADQARDAAELVTVDYSELPSVTDMTRARRDVARVWEDVPGNLCFDWAKGDAAKVQAAMDAAHRIVTLDLVNTRIAPTSMEGRACLADHDAAAGRSRLWVSSQGVHFIRKALADVMGLAETDLQVLTTDVGGGFGMKIFLYPEYVLALLAARRLGRPVRWTSDRSEAFLSDDHGRDNLTRAEMAVDRDGRFLGLKVRTRANMGAYLSNYAPFVATEAGTNMLSGVYTVPAVDVGVEGVFTNTAPVDAYRGAGRPEAAYVIERMADAVADTLGLDPAEVRRRNFIPADAMPYKTPLKHTYDSGDFRRCMEEALVRADYAGVPARRTAARARGKLLGVGLSCYIEACSGGSPEQATVQVDGKGRVTVLIGTQSNGQGHETSYKQIVADRLGLAPEDVTIVQGDSDRITYGAGTGGSRSIPVGGAALAATVAKVVDTAKIKAADLLEAAAVDIAFTVGPDGGAFEVVGTDRRVSFQDVAAQAAADGGMAFEAVDRWGPTAATFPNGCHVCEVEIDMDTGVPTILRYTVVDDFGTVLNPLLLEGQVHGGIAQGIGQALMEHAVYDSDSGQLVTGSFMDYGMPRADSLPFVDFHLNGVPCVTNAMGMKGAGEAGTIGATPAVMNALVDALSPLGVRHVDMPATPQVLWGLIHGGDRQAAAE